MVCFAENSAVLVMHSGDASAAERQLVVTIAGGAFPTFSQSVSVKQFPMLRVWVFESFQSFCFPPTDSFIEP